MKKFFLSLAVFVMALYANAQTNQYFWYNGNLMMGNPIAQIDSVTFGEGEPADTLHILLPRTIIKEVHDTVYITVHDTVCPNEETFHNGYRYVDLGLSVMWADANVGAENPEDYGNYYCWAETMPRDYYGFYNYKYGSYDTMTKYVMDENHGTIDGLSILQPEDDAASVNMGGDWRIPTKEEWEELLINCEQSLDTVSSHPGIRFTASNGHSIFIPKAGNMWGNSIDDWEDISIYGSGNSVLGQGVAYWSSNVYVSTNLISSSDAYAFSNRAEDGVATVRRTYRTQGNSVRGVFTKTK